jgi:hypothetical protein
MKNGNKEPKSIGLSMEIVTLNSIMLVRINDGAKIEFKKLLMKKAQHGSLLRKFRQLLLIIFLSYLLQAQLEIWRGVFSLCRRGFQKK